MKIDQFIIIIKFVAALALLPLVCQCTSIKLANGNDELHTPLLNPKHPIDMALIYTGGNHRPDGWWQPKHFAPYVSLKNDDGSHDWLFDGFLFLEIKNDHWSFFGRHGSQPARKNEWKLFADTFFSKGKNIYALNEQIGNVLSVKNDPDYEKRKIIIAIPEPKEGQKDWGEIDGKKMDFDLVEDQVLACNWYIDYVLEKYHTVKDELENIELVSFYWIKENDPLDDRIVKKVAEYIHTKGYGLVWIPNLLGLEQVNYKVQSNIYDMSYLQPGYFYRTDKDSIRLRHSSDLINKYKLNPYIEFDERALIKKRNWGYRLQQTINVFEEYNFWETKHIGYYQGFSGFYNLYDSTEAADNMLYQRLAKIIANRQKKYHSELKDGGNK